MNDKPNIIVCGFDLCFYCETESIIEAIAEKLGSGDYSFANRKGTASCEFNQSHIITRNYISELYKELDELGSYFDDGYECKYRFIKLHLRVDCTDKANFEELC
jgi:hypothetical protein